MTGRVAFSTAARRRWVQHNLPPFIWLCTILVGQGFFSSGPWPWIGPCAAVAILALAAILADDQPSNRIKTAAYGVLLVAFISLLMKRDGIAWMQSDYAAVIAMCAVAILAYGLIGSFSAAMSDER